MSRYCLDSSAYSHLMRGHAGVTTLLDQAEWIGVPAIAIGELRTGFLLGRRRSQNEMELAEFLSHPVVELVSVDNEVARHFAEVVVDLRRSGTPLPTNDVWIAASAARSGSLVLTFDQHFEAITRVGSVVLDSDDPA